MGLYTEEIIMTLPKQELAAGTCQNMPSSRHETEEDMLELFMKLSSRGIILKSLKESSERRTVVLVSHRTSTMNGADRVFEMKNGRSS